MLVLNNINKSFKNIKVLKNICFTLQENKIFAFLGPNGVGKTTLTNLSKKSPTSISRGWIAFFIFLKLFQKYDIIKSVKGNKKGVFLE